MSFELPKLPYALNALQPYISQETLEYHYGKHHQAYVNKLNGFVEKNNELADKSLEEIIKTATGGVFNNAAQIWNHTFYWHCMEKNGGSEPGGDLANLIKESFGDFTSFREKFSQTAATQFGSGWAWLVKDSSGKLKIYSTSNANTPLTEGETPLLTCDVWEHAYYIDTRNDRPKYIENFWNLINWDFVASNLSQPFIHP